MHLDWFQKYLVAINIIAFCLFTIDFVRYLQSGKGIRHFWICDIALLAGGSIGTLIALLLWDRKIVKENITWRVYVICLLIIHIVIYFFVYGILNGQIGWKGFDSLITGITLFAKTYMWFWYYLLGINLATFIAFAIDKVRAINHQWRLRELALLGMCMAWGAVGGLIAMYSIRHKTNSKQFSFGLPMIIIAHVVLMVYWIARCI